MSLPVSEKSRCMTVLQKILGLGSYQTAWTCLHKFRRLMILNGRNKLQGTVEVDEVFLGGKVIGKRGRGAEGKSIIAVAIEINGKKTCRMKLDKIPKATSETLSGFIENDIEKSSKIIFDAWTGYTGLDKLGYEYEIQNSSVKDGDEEILPNVHRIASLLKRWLLGTHQSYLNKKAVF